MKHALLFLVALTVVAAEPKGQLLLQPIDRPSGLPGEVRCSPYFALTSWGSVVFLYKEADGTLGRGMTPKTLVAVEIKEGEAMYEKVESPNGPHGAKFYLSQADYNGARACLPPPAH
jgi:hypothetical protein